MSEIKPKVRVVDLFCGAGGLTHGLIQAGLDVVAGIDNDPSCEYPYTANNPARFILKDIQDVQPRELNALYKGADIKVLVGCAPCQPYSALNQHPESGKDRLEQPLAKFASLIEAMLPEVVSMENVRNLAKKGKYPVFDQFIKCLLDNGYHIDYKVLNAADFGVPQNRYRLVLLASRLGAIEHLKPQKGSSKITVRDAIGVMPAIVDGVRYAADPLHRSPQLSDLNKARMLATPKDGGDARDWPDELVLKCHAKEQGVAFRRNVYGRMKWDEPAPTMTTQCVGFGNGRYGHPDQNRAISLREASILQSFPNKYKFSKNANYNVSNMAKLIGNAVPVKLGKVIGLSIKQHVEAKAL